MSSYLKKDIIGCITRITFINMSVQMAIKRPDAFYTVIATQTQVYEREGKHPKVYLIFAYQCWFAGFVSELALQLFQLVEVYSVIFLHEVFINLFIGHFSKF